MRFGSLLVALVALTGCGEPLQDGFDASLTKRGGCADTILFAHDDADTMLLRVETEGLIAAAQAAGDEVVTTFEVPDDALTLQVEVGHRVSDAICDDVIENGGPHVTRTWTATAGTVTFTTRPNPDDPQLGNVDLHLDGIVFEEGGDSVPLDTFDFTDMPVGWLAG